MDLDSFAAQLVGAHAILALVLKDETWKLDESQARKLAQAIRNLSQHYNISISPVALAWSQLITVCAAIYLPKLAIVGMKLRIKREETKKAQALAQATSGAIQPATPAAQPPSDDGKIHFY